MELFSVCFKQKPDSKVTYFLAPDGLLFFNTYQKDKYGDWEQVSTTLDVSAGIDRELDWVDDLINLKLRSTAFMEIEIQDEDAILKMAHELKERFLLIKEYLLRD